MALNEDNLILFPVPKDGKILLLEFLEASKRLAILVGDLGTIFAPLSSDMTNNINTIRSSNIDLKTIYIDDLLLYEKSNGKNTAPVALLWLKRALHFYLIFFKNILKDTADTENLEPVMAKAYEESLEPYHGWFTRKLFLIFKKACPVRTSVIQILSNRMDPQMNVLQQLSEFCNCLESNIHHIDAFYLIHKIDTSSRVA